MDKMYSSLANWLVHHTSRFDNDYEIYKYGFQSGFEHGIFVITCIIIALLIDYLGAMLLFLLVFNFVRPYIGGFHFKKFIHCYLLSVASATGVVLLSEFITINITITFIMTVVLILITFVCLLFQSRELERKAYRYYRKKLIRNLSIIMCLGSIQYIFNCGKVGNVICRTLLLTDISFLLNFRNTLDKCECYCKVSEYSTVRFDKNNYSVPADLIGREVTIKAYGNDIKIYYKTSNVAYYNRIYGSGGQTIYTLEHYMPLLERKPRSVFNAKPVRQVIQKDLLDWGMKFPNANKDTVKLLRLCLDYGTERIISIKNQIPYTVNPTIDLVRSYLDGPVPNSIPFVEKDVTVDVVDLSSYDNKFGMVVNS